jgi:hypothetical protein
VNQDKFPLIWAFSVGAAYVVGLIASALVASWGFTVGFAGGGALVFLNALASMRRLKKTDFTNKFGALTSVMGSFYLRLILLGVCLFALITYTNLDPLGLVAGLSVVPAGLIVLLILIQAANRRPEEA